MWWIVPLLCGAGVSAFGGPPLPYGVLSALDTVALPGQAARRVSPAELGDGAWHLLEHPKQRPSVVSIDDLERLSTQPRPPFEFALPVNFRADPLELVEAVPMMDAEAGADGSFSEPPPRGLVAWLPQRVQSWLPSLSALPALPSLSSLVPHLPSYLPGFEIEAEVHRKPTQLPHIPSPADILKDVNSMMDRILKRLHQKQEQILEVIKCTCPRPARCESLFQEFLGNSATTPAPAAAVPGAGGTPEAAEPSLSLFTGITKPDGAQGPGFGFFVDKTGPHLGHHVHGATPTSSSSSSATSSSSAMSSVTSSGSAPSSSAYAQSSASASAGVH